MDSLAELEVWCHLSGGNYDLNKCPEEETHCRRKPLIIVLLTTLSTCTADVEETTGDYKYLRMFSYHISTKTWNHIQGDCCHPSVASPHVQSTKSLDALDAKRYKQYIFGSKRSKDYGAQLTSLIPENDGTDAIDCDKGAPDLLRCREADVFWMQRLGERIESPKTAAADADDSRIPSGFRPLFTVVFSPLPPAKLTTS
ncbi:hypothetical protein pipiens_002314 [Culex pipiens pipiens]|uniref:Uncharacterized protein n=1 Tax=Culex pipiens pipiens TaxID=38569 RepID=A0ABD1DKK4_CULPP